jgi:hypothetical protein
MRISAVRSWRIRDAFGDEWNLALATPARRAGPEAAPSWEQRRVVDNLVYFTFDHARASDDAAARALLAIYDALTRAHFASTLPRPTRDPRRLLAGFDRELRARLWSALSRGEVTIEKVPRALRPSPTGDDEAATAPNEATPERTPEARAAPAESGEFPSAALAAQVAALKAAAAAGVPFCEECAKARARASAA